MSKVFIKELTVTACHGVHDFEKVKPQRFVFDIDMDVDFLSAAQTDDLNGTVSYSDVARLVSKLVVGNTFNLIEKLADFCAGKILQTYPLVKSITLTVHKPDVPLGMPLKSVGVTVERTRVEAYLALGSSLGDRKANLDFAVEQLQKTEGITVERVSSYHQTAPYGGVAKNEFLNGAVAITTWLTPHELLAEVQRIERQGGRVRNVHWEDRTLDIDIIFYGQQVICDKDLQVPHPEWDKRDFVLVPLKEVAECFIPPIAGKTVKNT